MFPILEFFFRLVLQKKFLLGLSNLTNFHESLELFVQDYLNYNLLLKDNYHKVLCPSMTVLILYKKEILL